MPRVRLVVAFLALFAMALAGCGGGNEPSGGGGDNASPNEAVAAAATKTSDAGSSRVSFTIEMTDVGSQPVRMTGDGLFDSKTREGRMTMDLSQLGQAAGAQLGKAQVVFQDFTLYMKFPFLRQLQPNLKPWLKFDLQALGKQQGFDLGQLSQLNQGDPTQALAYLRGASSDTKKVGEEDVRGTQTTHYHMTVDLKKVAANAPPEQRKQVQASIDEIVSKTGVRQVPTDVWIDDDGLVRRIRIAYKDFQFTGSQKGDMTMTQELYDFGVEVNVSPPPADQVSDISDILNPAQTG